MRCYQHQLWTLSKIPRDIHFPSFGEASNQAKIQKIKSDFFLYSRYVQPIIHKETQLKNDKSFIFFHIFCPKNDKKESVQIYSKNGGSQFSVLGINCIFCQNRFLSHFISHRRREKRGLILSPLFYEAKLPYSERCSKIQTFSNDFDI